MWYLLTRWLLVALSLVIAAWLIPGVVVESLYAALISAALLGLVNLVIRPILFVLTIPITVVTLGLFILVINGVLFWFVAGFVEGFAVSGFWAAIGGAFTVSVVSFIGNRLVRGEADNETTTPRVIEHR